MKLNEEFWTERYEMNQTGWDLGMPAPALIEYVENGVSKEAKILIPGAGNAWEAEYLFKNGWTNVHVLDISPAAIESFKSRFPDFPERQLICSDFFELDEFFDLILEQTFFCALDPSLRASYAHKMQQLLKPDGALVGVLFKIPLYTDHPPFGGKTEDYESIFDPYFIFEIWEECRNSVAPRAGNERFMKLRPKK